MNCNNDEQYMYLALELAQRAFGRTSPNPLVGAVIVKNGKIIGKGYHKKAGTQHAEIHALIAAGAQANGATIYVNLEPCSHYGSTPPCANALVQAGIRRVVIATLDPNPKVAGKGVKILQDAGIETTIGILADKAAKLNEVFFKYITTQNPFVIMKTAMTLDGKIATYSGHSRWVTGESAREYVHRLRMKYDAIMVGIGTVLKDNPRLNTRLDLDDKKDPVRVILDGNLDLPLDSNIVKTARQQKTIVFTADIRNARKAEALAMNGIEIIQLSGDPERLSVQKALKILGQLDISSILLEGGGEVNSYFIENQLVDKFFWFIAPKIIGGKLAPSPIAGKGIGLMSAATRVKITEIKHFGDDICIIGYPDYSPEC